MMKSKDSKLSQVLPLYKFMNKLAAYPQRIFAFLIDGMLAGIFSRIVRFYFPEQQVIDNALTLTQKQVNVQITGHNFFIELIIGLAPLLLFAYLVSKYSATPGKKLMGIMVKSESGRNLTLKEAILRELGKIVSAFPFLLGFIWTFFDKKRQAWHDKFVKSLVVVAK